MIRNLLRRRSTWITITAAIVVTFLLWQTAIIEIILFAQFNGPQEGNAIALSFDDGPDWGEEVLISALNEAGIRATFFWTWGKIEEIRSIDNKGFERILRLIEEGEHEIGIHGYYCHISWNPIDRFLIFNEQENISVLKNNYYELFDKEPQLYRSHGARSGRQFYNSLKNSGLKLAFGSFAYQISNQESADIFIEYFQNAEPGSIICAHDSNNCDPNYGTAIQIAQIVAELGEIANNRNLKVVTISELLNLKEASD